MVRECVDEAAVAAVERRVGELLARPGMAFAKSLASMLADSILAELPRGTPVDAAALTRKCAAAIVLAEKEGVRRMAEIAALLEGAGLHDRVGAARRAVLLGFDAVPADAGGALAA